MPPDELLREASFLGQFITAPMPPLRVICLLVLAAVNLLTAVVIELNSPIPDFFCDHFSSVMYSLKAW
jgi:hypothetical protein